ncbi:MAG TPA: alkaline phosphatase family protein [Anaerolineales bacterium]
MADLTPEILPALQAHRLPGLDLGAGFLYPAYQGRSILNIPASICRLLGASEIAGVPLEPDILAPLGGGELRRVMLIVMDALALHRLQRWMDDGVASIWSRLAKEGLLAPLTSIVPSTTSAALTTLWTGRSAAEHGVTGYEMWMKEFGVVANTITLSPITYKNDAGSLLKAGFDPNTVLPFPTLGTHLAAHQVSSYAFQHHSIAYSGLSQMFFKRVSTHGFSTSSDLWVNLRQLLESSPTERQYIYVYWSEVDTLSHRYGPDDERVAAEFGSFSAAFERLFLSRLGAAGSLKGKREGDTLILLTADHGAITTRPDPFYELQNHPSLLRRLHILPTGENRLAYLYIRPGQSEAVREYIDRRWPGQFALLDPAYAVEAGLFGPGKPHPGLIDRLGDLVAVARGEGYWWWHAKENRLLGRHGGLHPEEMLVPLLAVRI